MKRLFIDMDRVIVDYDDSKEFIDMAPVEMAIEAITEIADIKCCTIWILMSLFPGKHGFGPRLDWAEKHLPQFSTSFVTSSNMELICDEQDMLITNYNNYERFPGILIDFSKPEYDWQHVIDLVEMALDIELP